MELEVKTTPDKCKWLLLSWVPPSHLRHTKVRDLTFHDLYRMWQSKVRYLRRPDRFIATKILLTGEVGRWFGMTFIHRNERSLT